MSNAIDFAIENGALWNYTGPGGDVVIPEGVTVICDHAFYGCSNLTSVVIPNSVTRIGGRAFGCCDDLTSIVIPDSMTRIDNYAFADCGKLKSVTLPDSITEIGYRAFRECSKLKDVYYCGTQEMWRNLKIVAGNSLLKCATIHCTDGDFLFETLCCGSCDDNLTWELDRNGVMTISGTGEMGDYFISYPWFDDTERINSIIILEGVTYVGKGAFGACNSLRDLTVANRNCRFGKDVFGKRLPSGLVDKVLTLCPHMTDGDIKRYILDKKTWNKLDVDTQMQIYLKYQSKSFLPSYGKCISNCDAFGKALLDRLPGKPSAKDCSVIANFMMLFSQTASAELLRKMYEILKPLKTAEKALRSIHSDPSLMQIVDADQKSDVPLSAIEQKMLNILQKQKLSSDEPERRFAGYYSKISLNGLELKDKTGQPVPLMVTYWLMTAHETWAGGPWDDVDPAYPNPGLCPEAESLVEELDPASLQSCLRSMATNLGMSGRSKKMFLAYPICRYADEAYMEELTKAARSWSSSVSGNNAPPLRTFRKASAYSNTRSAMLFADKYGDLEEYAKLRGFTEDVFRDRYLSDIGIDESGGKTYDLGNQSVTVRLQKDLSFRVELPSGKTVKTLPKKGADAEKYAIANGDFSEMKKLAKKIVKNRNEILLKAFLSGKKQNAQEWCEAYLHNPLLRSVASLVVWNQDGKTFVLKDGQPVTSTEQPYSVGNKPISVAHPMEMGSREVQQWQQYFTSHSLKQPFAQIWEPVIDPNTIQEDRYKDIRIPYFRFMKQEKHGIHIEDFNFHDEMDISFDECNARVESVDWIRHMIDINCSFEVTSFGFEKYSRQVNHIVGLLDKWAVYGRILKDDTSITNQLSHFTLAQIEEFLKLAMENNCTNCTAALLAFKNANFADFDPMAEFTLEL